MGKSSQKIVWYRPFGALERRLIQHLGLSIVLFYGLASSLWGQQAASIEIRTIGIPPYGIQENKKASGVYYEVANRLAEKAGFQANNYIYPYARIVNELKSGQTDLTIMFKYPELEGHVTYIAALPSLKTVVVGLKGSRYQTLDDLQGKTLAYLRGAKFSDVIDENPLIYKRLTEDFAQGARMLLYGRVDAIIGPLAPILNAINDSSKAEDVLGVPLIVAERTPWVQISNHSSSLLAVDELKEVFAAMESTGELQMIREKYEVVRD